MLQTTLSIIEPMERTNPMRVLLIVLVWFGDGAWSASGCCNVTICSVEFILLGMPF